jgi:hypothetical protein
VVLDALGYLQPGAESTLSVFDAPPILVDTRGGKPLAGFDQVCARLTQAGVPAQVSAVMLNVTVFGQQVGSMETGVYVTPKGGSVLNHPEFMGLSGRQKAYTSTAFDEPSSGGEVCFGSTGQGDRLQVLASRVAYSTGTGSGSLGMFPSAIEIDHSSIYIGHGSLPLDAGDNRCWRVSGPSGIVRGDAKGMVVSVASRHNSGRGYLALFASDLNESPLPSGRLSRWPLGWCGNANGRPDWFGRHYLFECCWGWQPLQPGRRWRRQLSAAGTYL